MNKKPEVTILDSSYNEYSNTLYNANSQCNSTKKLYPMLDQKSLQDYTRYIISSRNNLNNIVINHHSNSRSVA